MKKCSRRFIMYECRNILGNPFVFIFGMFFPLLMLFIITRAMRGEAPESYTAVMNTGIFIQLSLIIPMAVVLLGYSASFSEELQEDIPLRLELFGFSGKTTLLAKIAAQFFVLTTGLSIYTIVGYAALDLQVPRVSSALCFIICMILISVLFFALAHGVSLIFKKFGPTYAILMSFYFGVMILCGMMGLKTEDLPVFFQKIAALLPMSYIGNDFIDFWQEGSYNFAPLIQAYLFFGGVSGIILLLALRREKRNQGSLKDF